MKVGVIGLNMGRGHALAARKADFVDEVIGCDLSPERRAAMEKEGVECVESVPQLLARGIDAAFVVTAPAVHAASPFVGSWAIESFGQAEELVFQFTSDTEMVISVGDERTPPQRYGVDTAKKELTLPLSDGSELTLRYVLAGTDSFVLYMGPALLDQMVAAFTASLPQGANPLTDQIVEELRKAVRDVFVKSPFMRGTRLR